ELSSSATEWPIMVAACSRGSVTGPADRNRLLKTFAGLRVLRERFIQSLRLFFTNWTVSRPKCMLLCFCAPVDVDARARRSRVSDCALVWPADAPRRTLGPRER